MSEGTVPCSRKTTKRAVRQLKNARQDLGRRSRHGDTIVLQKNLGLLLTKGGTSDVLEHLVEARHHDSAITDAFVGSSDRCLDDFLLEATGSLTRKAKRECVRLE